mgnify:CR=1 FL=1
MAETTVAYKCPNCAAPLSFKPGAENVTCEYCDEEFSVETVEKMFQKEQERAAKAAQASIGGKLEETSVSVTGPDVLALNRAMLDLPEIIGISVADVSLEEAFEELTGE